jgi:hypothetical protein
VQWQAERAASEAAVKQAVRSSAPTSGELSETPGGLKPISMSMAKPFKAKVAIKPLVKFNALGGDDDDP